MIERRFARHRWHGTVGHVLRHAHCVAGGQRGRPALPRHPPMAPHRHQYRRSVMLMHRVRRTAARDEIHLKPRFVTDDASLSDDLARPVLGQGHHVVIPAHAHAHDLHRGHLGIFRQFLVGQNGHWGDTLGQSVAFLAVIKLTILAQHQPMIAGVLDHLRGPDHATTGIIPAKDGHNHPVIRADILEAPENARGDVDDIAFFQHHLARVAPATPEKPPAP
mmetsp:Transcript_27481/g.50755  ORF Transcript_27481/g.50755 Transcript_27481/m.50755 type:complete len:220 (-) Transcript_27481:310-969(-)